jgi:hypothetical protein
MTSETKTREGTGAFMSNLIPVLTLLVIGYPLAPATIRAMLVGWILIGGAITRSILGHHFQITGSVVTIRTGAARLAGCGRYRWKLTHRNVG